MHSDHSRCRSCRQHACRLLLSATAACSIGSYDRDPSRSTALRCDSRERQERWLDRSSDIGYIRQQRGPPHLLIHYVSTRSGKGEHNLQHL